MRALEKNRERGSLVLVALCFTAVISIALASYITVCYRSAQLSSREFHSKHARYLAEVGLEEALWALNNATWTTSGPASNQSWTTVTTTKTLTLAGYVLGSGATGSLSLRITNATGNNPGISSVATITLSSGKIYTKTLTANTNTTDVQRAPLFGNAVAATNRVRFQNVTTSATIDSYNSASGVWNASTNKSYSAVVAGDTVAPGAAIIDGYATTNGNAVTPSTAGKIRRVATDTVNDARKGTSAFIPLFKITRPTTTPTTISNSSQTISTSGYYRYSGNYTLGGGGTLTISAPNVLIDITGNFTLGTTDKIVINSGCSLQLFILGNVTISNTATGGFQNNAANSPAALALFCDGVNSTFSYTAPTNFTGVIYHYNASSTTTILSFTSSATFNGAILSDYQVNFAAATTPSIHYDMALRTAFFSGITTPFIINQLAESVSER